MFIYPNTINLSIHFDDPYQVTYKFFHFLDEKIIKTKRSPGKKPARPITIIQLN